MAQHTRQSALPPLIDDLTVKDVFAEGCVGVSFVGSNIHMTFVSLTADHSTEPAPIKRIVSGRLVMPLQGVIEFRDMLGRIIEMLSDQASSAPTKPTIITPSGRPH